MKYVSRILYVLIIFGVCTSGSAQESIATVRQLSEGSIVEVEGILMDDGSFAPNRFLQDSTAAIMLYLPGTEEEELLNQPRGTRVRLTGTIDEYRSQVEIRDVSSWQITDQNAPLFEPLELEMNAWDDSYSARYIRIPAFQFKFPGLPLTKGQFEILRGSNEAELDYTGTTQFMTDEAGYSLTGFLQEDYSDFILRSSDTTIVQSTQTYRTSPRIEQLDHRSVRIAWKGAGYVQDSVILASGDGSEIIQRAIEVDSPHHSLTFEHLQPSEDYSITIRSDQVDGEDRLRFRTTDGLPDEIEFYFNYPVDTTISEGWIPDGTTGLQAEEAVINRIDAAEEQIDFCMYNNNREDIVRALKRAHNRGVQVRYITDDETTNWALGNTSLPFTVVDGNIGDGLMHNKFIVIDPDRTEKAWVVTGAMNMTTGQIATDYNHLVFIREQSLALTYEQEFEEMWGSEGPEPIPAESHFGENKTSNTPVHHSLFGSGVELYFAPTDRVSDQIRRTLAAGEHRIEFALLLLTQNEIGTTLIRSVEEGLKVRGIMENAFGPGSEFNRMRQGEVEVYEDIHSSAIFHHKYAIVDAGFPNPRLMTGSYNWSYSAESIHDENYIIFHHPDIVNVFAQDFKARYCEIVDCATTVVEADGQYDLKLYPNPARERVHISIPESMRGEPLTFKWYRSDGRLMQAKIYSQTNPSPSFDVRTWPAGMYWLQIKGAKKNFSIPVYVEHP